MLIRDKFDREETSRASIAAFFFILTVAILILRLMQLQLFLGTKYQLFSEKNRITIKKVHAVRGRIFDRHGNLLADNRPSFDIEAVRGYLGPEQDMVLGLLAEQLSLDIETIQSIKKKLNRSPKYEPTTILEDVPLKALAFVEARRHSLPGLRVHYRPVRNYPNGPVASHLLGYLREVSKDRLSKLRSTGNTQLEQGDFIGVWGIEEKLDALLRGLSGAIPVVEDAWGREIGEEESEDLLPSLRRKDAVPGDDIYLTIDMNLQRVAEESFKYNAGAAVAIDPNSGEILAMVSKPTYDPDKFSRNIPADYWRELRNNPLNPLFDRAVMGTYPPGSIFKMIPALAAIVEKIDIKMESFQPCRGTYRIGRETKRCWKRYPGHGALDMAGAIKHSCDVYFYQLGLRMGVDMIARYARLFNLGQRSGVGINREMRGLIPTEAWKQKAFNAPWVDGETASVSIGQSFVSVTPLQAAVMTAMLANKGKRIVPRLVRDSAASKSAAQAAYSKPQSIGIPESAFDVIHQGMYEVVNGEGGTAYWGGRSREVEISGKTGTAQVVSLHSTGAGKPLLEDHGWFVGFAPSSAPTIAVAVIAENAGNGSSSAAPIVRTIIETFMHSRKEQS